jgi:hypothetical protein
LFGSVDYQAAMVNKRREQPTVDAARIVSMHHTLDECPLLGDCRPTAFPRDPRRSARG